MKNFYKKTLFVALTTFFVLTMLNGFIHVGSKTYNSNHYYLLYDLDYPQPTLNGYSLRYLFEETNLISNGDFSGGATDWTDSVYDSTIVNDTLRLNGNNAIASVSLDQTIGYLIEGDVFYLSFEMIPDVVANRDNRIFVNGQTVETRTTNLSGTYTRIFTKDATLTNTSFSLNYRDLSGGGFFSTEYIFFDNIKLINLTEMVADGILLEATQVAYETTINAWQEVYTMLKGLE